MKVKVFIVSALALLMGCWLASGQTIIGRPLMPLNTGGCTEYTNANTAVFGGASTYIYRNAPLTNVADGKQYTCSVWIKPDVASDGATKSIFEIDTGGGVFRVRLYKEASDVITFVARNSAGTLICQGQNTNKIVSTSGLWYHVFLSVDLANTNNRVLFVNGVAAREPDDWATYTDDTMDIDAAQQNVGSNPPATEQYRGALAELWVDDVFVSDLTAFRCESGRPADLGANGDTPTGAAPALYLSRNGSGNAWATDSSGSGNTFNLQNALGSTTSP